jgi:allophanate hydrolase subunit 1
MNWVSYGPNSLLFRFAEQAGELALSRQRGIVMDLERHPPAGLVEFVPAYTTILLVFDPKTVPEPKHEAEELIERFEAACHAKLQATPVKEIPIRYDGEDLEAVARRPVMTVEKVCELHSAPVYRVYMLGFSPGFPYLGDLDPPRDWRRLG